MHFRTVCLVFGLIATAIAQTSPSNNLTVPAGTQFEVRLDKPLYVTKVQIGETFTLRAVRETKVGSIKVPSNARFQAQVLKVKAIRKGQKGESELQFIVERISWKNTELTLNAFPVSFGRGTTASVVRPNVPSFSFLQSSQAPHPAVAPNSTAPQPRTFPPESGSRSESTIANHDFSNLLLPEVFPLQAPERGTVLRQKDNIKLDTKTLIVIEQMP
jgi:hypothetical protein